MRLSSLRHVTDFGVPISQNNRKILSSVTCLRISVAHTFAMLMSIFFHLERSLVGDATAVSVLYVADTKILAIIAE